MESERKQSNIIFTEGPILGPLIRFALPILLALFLQVMYNAVDLWVVGNFAAAADVSAVSTGAQVMTTITMIVIGMAMGITIMVGQRIGQGRPREAGEIIGSGIAAISVLALLMTALAVGLAGPISSLLNAPEAAFDLTVVYVRICSGGFIFIVAYNVIGSVFRGVGDSRMPLITVAIACVLNIGLDLLLVGAFRMGAAGAALATVLAQAVSVALSWFIIRRRELPFTMERRDIRFNWRHIGKIMRLGTPIALQDLLVSISFLVLLGIVNAISLEASAGMGVAERICGFIMLVPSAFMQSMSAFVAQNVGAGKLPRARRALRYGILLSLGVGFFMAWLSFFHGDILAAVFDPEAVIVKQAFDYLRAYSIDCMLTPFLFCLIGYFNGCGKTVFLMIQGLAGAFCVRIPVAFLVSRMPGATLFHIGLATPASTVVQIAVCLTYFAVLYRREKRGIFIEAV